MRFIAPFMQGAFRKQTIANLRNFKAFAEADAGSQAS